MTYHIDSILGFATAGTSTVALWLAEATPANVEPWIQTGGTVGLICGLSYGCVTLWKANQQQKSDIADLNKEIRSEWKQQNDALISVLKKLDPDP